MNRYNVVLLHPTGYVHALALWDVCRLLHYSFQSLGIAANLRENELDPGAINVVVGYHMLDDLAPYGKNRVIFYQMEQMSETGGWFNPERLEILKRAEEIWDYSPENVAFLKARGLANVKLLPLGFHEGLKTIVPAPKDIDVLFYGGLNARRRGILNQLDRLCRITVFFGKYGQERDAYIARAKIVLNLHYYPALVMEQARISYLLNNACCVVSETSGHNPYEGMMATVPYEEVPHRCVELLNDEPARVKVAEEGYQKFMGQPMTENLRAVLK